MSEYTKVGFEINYTLHPDFAVKSLGAGDFQGTKYPASIKIVSRNMFERLNQKTQAYDEIEEEITFKILCETDELAGDLLHTFRTFRRNGQIVHLKGGLPNANGDVIVLNNPNEFVIKDIKDNKEIKKGS